MPKHWNSWAADESDPIAEGGQGRVWKVKHQDTQVLGALKELKNLKRRDRFQREIDNVSKLQHDNIVRLLEYDLEHRYPYAVFEFVNGPNLGDLDRDSLNSIPVGQKIRWCEQLCDALEHAHNAKLIHRDIKPENVILSRDTGIIKLADFGLVYDQDEHAQRVTSTEEQVGSRYFIPPECESGRQVQVLPESDFYCIGKLLYFLLSGGRRFPRENHRAGDISLHNSSPYYEAVHRVLDKTVTERPADRVGSAAELKRLLADCRMALENEWPIPGVTETYKCLFCRRGTYRVVATSHRGGGHNLGYGGEGNISKQQFVFLECELCGNSQRFKIRYSKLRGHGVSTLADWFPSEEWFDL